LLPIKQTSVNLLVQQSEQAYQLAQVRYKAGLITPVEILGAQTNVEEAKLQQVQLQLQLDKLESHKLIGTKLF
jgi:outer membrane protein